jgi:hypothetical protein
MIGQVSVTGSTVQPLTEGVRFKPVTNGLAMFPDMVFSEDEIAGNVEAINGCRPPAGAIGV